MAIDEFGVPFYGAGASPHEQAVFRDFASEIARSPWLQAPPEYDDETPIDHATGLPMTEIEIQRRQDWILFEARHPFRARLIQWLSRR